MGGFGIIELLVLFGVVFVLAIVPITLIALVVFAVTRNQRNAEKK